MFVQANSLLRSHRYEEAIGLYQEMRRKGLLPGGIVEFNLDFARRRWPSSGTSRPSPLPRKQQARGAGSSTPFASRKNPARPT